MNRDKELEILADQIKRGNACWRHITDLVMLYKLRDAIIEIQNMSKLESANYLLDVCGSSTNIVDGIDSSAKCIREKIRQGEWLEKQLISDISFCKYG